MDIKIRILLIIATISCFVFLIRGVKKGKFGANYMVGWIVASGFLVIMSLFPEMIYKFSEIIGIISPVNIVFLVIIFLLIILVFTLFNKVSKLEDKLKDVIQEISIKNNEE